ncbi:MULTISPECIES: amidase [unclassified Bradyrhizobium]|uniref:amidase n=1 Tax=unclassified Bradyrhizobium TaxID=2631580 RepID=UPI00247A0A44|nr:MULTISPECIES: amidase [unclassified Bradyrhizobium]WGS23347.1 amidase [Bradyrhizobium sp. ISRA463]WGS30360.1 amidase [Bradyrhizobium sp. ISRA464]
MSADPLHYKSITEIAELLRRREARPSEITEEILNRVARLDGKFHGYALVLAERAMAQARRYDDEIAKGIWRGPLHGVPIGLKDLCYTTFAPTAGGTTIHAKFVPSFNATIVDRLERAGAVTLGKLKMTEGAYTSHHPDNQAPLNPWNTNYWVGSSSTGSGVATSAGLCYGAIGSDTGGSIRFPSATCGLTGIKPTWGRVSRHGIFSLAGSLDHVGPMCRSAADAGAMLGVIAGADVNDPTALRAAVPNYLAGIGDGIRGLRIGVDRRYTQDGIDPQVVVALLEAERALADLGAEIREVKFPSYEKLVSMWIPMCSVETAEAHLETYPARKLEYGPDLALLIEQGRSVSGVEIAAIHHERLIFSGSLAALFSDIDLLLVPTMPVPIPTLAKMSEYGADPSILLSILRFTAVFDFSGSPTITLPMGMASDHMPLSMQLVGPHLSEDVLARAGHAFQSATDWHTRRPPVD